MGIMWTEGFDAYGAIADLSDKFTMSGTANMALISGHYSGQALRFNTGATDQRLYWGFGPGRGNLNNDQSEFILGFDFMLDVLPSTRMRIWDMREENNDLNGHVDIDTNGDIIFDNEHGDILTSSTQYVAGTWAYLEFRARLDETGNTGFFHFFVNGSTAGSATSVNTERDPTTTYFGFVKSESTPVMSIDHVYWVLANANFGEGGAITDALTQNTPGDIGMRIETIYPNGAGSQENWGTRVGGGTNNYEAVDEGAATSHDGNTTYVEEATGGSIQDLYAFSNLATILSGETIENVAVNITAMKPNAGAGAICALAREGATTGTPIALPFPFSTYANRAANFPLNPDTAAKWTVAEVDGAEFGMETE